MGLNANISPKFEKIKVRFVLDVKADGHRKAQLITCRDMTPELEESVYSYHAFITKVCGLGNNLAEQQVNNNNKATTTTTNTRTALFTTIPSSKDL